MHSCRKWIIKELSGFFNVVFSRYPWHASCVINWAIPQTCDTVKSLIVEQLKLWEVITIFVSTNKSFLFYQNIFMFTVQTSDCPGTSADCPSLPCGQRCLYNFTTYEPEDQTISGTHQTPKHR